ncbi:MAG: preprotein translocase subunit YajC [Alphaproteobacteria bacterium]|jgi:preprotein translocase subunit YajC|nr:preprotein translocase subunit YajC [Alphaproteobacteria bacterium]MBP9877216.1 preprotein translocase subunit YajC [Alphaproteobacteria bacterium]
MSIFNEAIAQTADAGAAAPQSILMNLLPFGLLIVVFYFLLIRPQQKRMKEHKTMVDNLRRGDRVVSAGGLIGTINRVGEGEEIEVEIANGVIVTVVKSTITTIMNKNAAGVKVANDSSAGQKKAKSKK